MWPVFSNFAFEDESGSSRAGSRAESGAGSRVESRRASGAGSQASDERGLPAVLGAERPGTSASGGGASNQGRGSPSSPNVATPPRAGTANGASRKGRRSPAGSGKASLPKFTLTEALAQGLGKSASEPALATPGLDSPPLEHSVEDWWLAGGADYLSQPMGGSAWTPAAELTLRVGSATALGDSPVRRKPIANFRPGTWMAWKTAGACASQAALATAERRERDMERHFQGLKLGSFEETFSRTFSKTF